MNSQLLIDTVVRQVTVLIAQLATSGGLLREVVTYLGQCSFERGLDEERHDDE